MLLTEGEAKFRFCPLLKTSDDKMKMCMGTQCMYWRWEDETVQDKGYCGMAGKPVAVSGA